MSKVYLVGAGPGDPGLLTLRGRDCLAQADVVLYDYLANPALLEHAPAGAELICLGQHGRATLWKQDRINDEMVRHARAGRSVVRLKGGDPAVFARFAEEASHLTEQGVDFEVVPGITAALAIVAYAGVPLTHREFASSVALVTGQENTEKQADALDFAALAQFPGTLVFYMGVTTATRWSQLLTEHGKSPDTPVALIRRCTCPDQRIVRCTLGDVALQLTPYQKLPPPVVAVVGPVAKFAAPAKWFVERPLFGQQILVTRAADQIGPLRNRLNSAGAEVYAQPAIEVSPPNDWESVDRAIDCLEEFDWLVFSSANGVRFFCNRLLEQGRDLRALAAARVAAIGSGTAAKLYDYHIRADLQPDTYRAESLAESLIAESPTGRYLLLRANRGRRILGETLAASGATVQEVIVYQSTNVLQANALIADDLAAGRFDWVTVTSSAIARSLVDLFGESLRQARLATISPLTSAVLRESGFEPAAEATQYNMEGLIDAIQHAVAGS